MRKPNDGTNSKSRCRTIQEEPVITLKTSNKKKYLTILFKVKVMIISRYRNRYLHVNIPLPFLGKRYRQLLIATEYNRYLRFKRQS